MRTSMRMFTWLTNAFAKRAESHGHSLAIYFVHHNFARIHKALRTTPAMAAGLTDRLWDMGDLVALVDAHQERIAKRPNVALVSN